MRVIWIIFIIGALTQFGGKLMVNHHNKIVSEIQKEANDYWLKSRKNNLDKIRDKYLNEFRKKMITKNENR